MGAWLLLFLKMVLILPPSELSEKCYKWAQINKDNAATSKVLLSSIDFKWRYFSMVSLRMNHSDIRLVRGCAALFLRAWDGNKITRQMLSWGGDEPWLQLLLYLVNGIFFSCHAAQTCLKETSCHPPKFSLKTQNTGKRAFCSFKIFTEWSLLAIEGGESRGGGERSWHVWSIEKGFKTCRRNSWGGIGKEAILCNQACLWIWWGNTKVLAFP